MFDANHHHRRSIRWVGYDYRNAGAYFVTVCAHQKRPVFGRCENGVVRLHLYGHIVGEEWQRTAQVRSNCVLDEWIVMPNHFHAILLLTDAVALEGMEPAEMDSLGMARHAPTGFSRPVAGSLSTIIGSFKSAVTRQINLDRAARDWSPVQVWQRGFYERVIRDEKELNDTRRYIIENPARWNRDEHP